MASTIVTRYAGECADCGAELPAGSVARYYGRGTLYGTECHEQKRPERNGRTPERSESIAETPPTAKNLVRVKAKREQRRKANHDAIVSAAAKTAHVTDQDIYERHNGWEPSQKSPQRPRFEIRKRGKHISGKGRSSRYQYIYEPYVGKGTPLPARLTQYEWTGITTISRMAAGIASVLGIRKPRSMFVSWPMDVGARDAARIFALKGKLPKGYIKVIGSGEIRRAA